MKAKTKQRIDERCKEFVEGCLKQIVVEVWPSKPTERDINVEIPDEVADFLVEACEARKLVCKLL